METQKTNLEKARAALSEVERESNERITAARAKLADLDGRSWRRDEAQAELDSLLRVRETAINRARQNVAIAQAESDDAEKAQALRESAIADEREKKLYENSLARYLANGGRREDFSQAWKGIREDMLQAAVVRDMTKGKKARALTF